LLKETFEPFPVTARLISCPWSEVARSRGARPLWAWNGVTEVVVVHLLHGLKPEFGYFDLFPSLRRKLSLILAFTVFGLVAGASSLALLVTDEPDARNAFALAVRSPTLQPLSREPGTPAAAAAMPAVDAVIARKITPADGIKSCQRNAGNDGDADCVSGAAPKPGVVPALPDPPATAELPIGHGREPAGGAPQPAVLVASAPPLNAEAPESADVVAASAPGPEAPAPAIAPAKPQRTARHQSGRRYSDNSYRRSARQCFLLFCM
jgi:hypothetical protein